MDNGYEAYRDLEYTDQFDEPRRYYTIKRVIRRKNKILKLLLPVTLVDSVENINRKALIANISAILGPPVWDVDKASRRSFKGSTNEFLDGLPFLPTPEESDPKGKQVFFAVEESLGYESQIPTVEQAKALAWRLAGNVHRLAEYMPVFPWSPEAQGSEWCLARVAEVVEADTYEGEPGFQLTYFFYTGAPAGLEFSRVFKFGREAHFASSLGITWKKCKLMYPQELTNMTGYVLLESGRSKGRLPIFRQTSATATHKKRNRQLYEDRFDPEKCPYGYKPEQFVQCIDCPLGYEESTESKTDIRCALSVRRKNGFHTHPSDETAGRDTVVCSGT